jgi:Zn-dependent peptidase ImmA (M78 family)/DNA-binding XRE family transcriptional regulator
METKNKQFYGNRLRILRQFHGLSLAELGEAVGTTRQYIQKLEVDPYSSAPTDLTIDAFAHILNVESSFFFEPLHEEVQEEECHFRKAKTTPVNIKTRARSYGTMFANVLQLLNKHIAFPKLNTVIENPPAPEHLHREDIERIAEKSRIVWGVFLDAPIDNITRTLENAGCIVATFEGVSEKVDAFSFIRSRAVIVSNTDKGNTGRMRFDRAHEGGHIVLHRGVEAGDPILDEQANQFASAFLLPRGAFIREFPASHRLNWVKMLQMAKRWGVSLHALVRRAYDLRLIDAVQYRYAHVYMNKHLKIDDFLAVAPPEEYPEVLHRSVDLLREKKGIFVRDIAKLLHVKPAILENYGIREKTDPSKVASFLAKKSL